jgi:hypothetical protein
LDVQKGRLKEERDSARNVSGEVLAMAGLTYGAIKAGAVGFTDPRVSSRSSWRPLPLPCSWRGRRAARTR